MKHPPVGLLALLLAPSLATAAGVPVARAETPGVSARVMAFYYPWYGNPTREGRYANWDHAMPYEWHEGTQIEPAVPKRLPGFAYLDYPPRPLDDYQGRTAYWVGKLTSAGR